MATVDDDPASCDPANDVRDPFILPRLTAR